ncbi:chemokine vCXCL14 [Saimiriine betaherpesvirus 4]|uniref:Chemokine vCXCL14 n=1 Tax=Saimiriine betaherpesvirus 4 TaxID=1535247 RepID=G8XT28_9BETA|nr:chemokine vCXCL14 [Saimiriine betaherpesvirus 4]AEV80974.1 chemokine vCXCL14 [Saimiriine betaherpesvirus 4]
MNNISFTRLITISCVIFTVSFTSATIQELRCRCTGNLMTKIPLKSQYIIRHLPTAGCPKVEAIAVMDNHHKVCLNYHILEPQLFKMRHKLTKDGDTIFIKRRHP